VPPYRGLEADPSRRLPSAVDRYPRAIVLGGLSKAAGLPGLRIGWLASPDQGALARCQTLKDYTTICHSAPSELLALIALRVLPILLDRNRSIVAANLALARSFFEARSDRFAWIAPEAGSVAFPLWTGPSSVEALAERALTRAGLMIASGDLFDLPGCHFRVGLGRRSLSAALERLDLVSD
jgi:aspartate/methionine/tyrosine aminotransferase